MSAYKPHSKQFETLTAVTSDASWMSEGRSKDGGGGARVSPAHVMVSGAVSDVCLSGDDILAVEEGLCKVR